MTVFIQDEFFILRHRNIVRNTHLTRRKIVMTNFTEIFSKIKTYGKVGDYLISNLEHCNSFFRKRDVFDCAEIRAQVFRCRSTTRIPAQSNASLFLQKDFKFFKFEFQLQ